MEIKGIVGRLLAQAFKIWTTPIIRYGIRNDGRFHVELLPAINELVGKSPGIDARLAGLDVARANLVIALHAVDELKVSAEQNKLELDQALERIVEAEGRKLAADKEAENVRKIADADVDVFKRLAGVPSRRQIGFERAIGFVLGVAASLAASYIYSGV